MHNNTALLTVKRSYKQLDKNYSIGKRLHAEGIHTHGYVYDAIRWLGYYYFRGDPDIDLQPIRDDKQRAQMIYEKLKQGIKWFVDKAHGLFNQILAACQWRPPGWREWKQRSKPLDNTNIDSISSNSSSSRSKTNSKNNSSISSNYSICDSGSTSKEEAIGKEDGETLAVKVAKRILGEKYGRQVPSLAAVGGGSTSPGESRYLRALRIRGVLEKTVAGVFRDS